MRFYSRIVFICNACFIVAVIMWFIEKSRRAHGNYDGLIKFQPLEATFVILGYSAIIVNFIFILLSVYWLASKKISRIPRWIVLFNLVMFPIQVYYHFILH